MVFRVEATQGNTIRLVKTVAYHTSRGVPVSELSDRCDRTLDRAARHDVAHYLDEQRAWYDRFWDASDVAGRRRRGARSTSSACSRPSGSTCSRLAQASARADQQGVRGQGRHAARATRATTSGTPRSTSRRSSPTRSPDAARNLLHFRSRMLPAARHRAREMAQSGALFPWRTINGEEASAYYAAGTAQVHIDADIAYALVQYVAATGDLGFLVRDGIDILVETVADVGRPRLLAQQRRRASFHIHGVTGPDEYTTVVNNNLFTNVMARYNLEQTVAALARITARGARRRTSRSSPRLGLDDDEVERVGALRRGDAHPVRRGARASTRRTTSSSTARCGTCRRPRTSCGRCCCTTTRW